MYLQKAGNNEVVLNHHLLCNVKQMSRKLRPHPSLDIIGYHNGIVLVVGFRNDERDLVIFKSQGFNELDIFGITGYMRKVQGF